MTAFKKIALFSGVVFCLTAGQVSAEDIAGDWNYAISESSVSGMCPMGRDGTGALVIADEGDGNYNLGYIKGMTCRPAAVCHLKGQCEGNECVFTVTLPVDNEGGKVTNSASISFDNGHGLGSGKSVYTHPAMRCSWTYLLMLTRE